MKSAIVVPNASRQVAATLLVVGWCAGLCPLIAQTTPPQGSFTMAQTISDGAQRTTLAFDGLAIMTGNLEAQSFFPPGKVADYTGFQYLRDNDPDNMGHNTSFLTRVANNVIYLLNDSQFTQLVTLAVAQQDPVNRYGYKRYPLMKAFRRLLDGDVPVGATGLNLDAVKQASRALYLLDGQISFDRALLYAKIYSSMASNQLAYLDAMKGVGWNSWPDITNDQIKTKMQGLPQGSAVAVMTYASDIFSWYAGSLDADVYFCPERHGTYFGGFYIKDAPAVGHEGYSISEQLTATAGSALCDSAQGYVTSNQAAWMSSLVATQRNNLYAGTTNIVQTRTQIATWLRSLRTSLASSNTVKAQVLTLSGTYGDLDGENNYNYTTVFAQVYSTLTTGQRTNLAALRQSIMSGTYSNGTPFDYTVCTTPFLYSDVITNASVLAPYVDDTDYLFSFASPTASFSATPTNGIGPLTVTFSDISAGSISNRYWSWGDGLTTNTTATSLTHTYSGSGTSTVMLIVSGPGGSSTNTIANYIRVIPVYTLLYAAGPNGTISGTTSQLVAAGASGAVVAAVPNPGYHFVDWSDSSTPNPRTDAKVSDNIGVTANFAINTYTLTYAAGPNGTISGTSLQTVDYGASGSAVTALPNAGYHFVNWDDSSPANPRTDAAVTTNISVAANFAPNPPGAAFTVNSRNGAGPLTVTFTDTSTGIITSRLWTFGDGETSTAGSPSHTYTNAGLFTVSLQVIGPGGTDTFNQSDLVTVIDTNVPPDTTPPVLAILNPADQQVFTNAGITVAGTASDASGLQSVTINGVGASLVGTNWSLPVLLSRGTNAFTVIATDQTPGFNTVTQHVRAVYTEPPSNRPPVINVAPSVTNALLIVSNQVIVISGATNLFTVTASDPDNNPLLYQWVFGDGITNAPSALSFAAHAYASSNCGPYAAAVTVSDGQFSVSSNLTVTVACALLTNKPLWQLTATVHFPQRSNDTAHLVARLDLGSEFSVTNQRVTVDIGGAQRFFTLDSKGRSGGPLGVCRLTYNKRTALWTITTTLSRGAWRDPWDTYGLQNDNIAARAGEQVMLPVAVMIGNEAFAAEPRLHYTAIKNRFGTAK